MVIKGMMMSIKCSSACTALHTDGFFSFEVCHLDVFARAEEKRIAGRESKASKFNLCLKSAGTYCFQKVLPLDQA